MAADAVSTREFGVMAQSPVTCAVFSCTSGNPPKTQGSPEHAFPRTRRISPMKSTLKVIHQGITLAVLLGCSARACAANAVVASPCGEAQFDTAFNAVNAGS